MNRLVKISLPLILILAVFLAVGCAAPESSSSTVPIPGSAPAPAPMAPAMERDASGAAIYNRSEETANLQSVDRKIIRTGHITLEVADIAKSIDEVTAIASELGGYVVSSNRRGNEDKISGSVSIRVPANRFDDAFIKLRAIALKVPYEGTNSQDVTEEYTDLQARLRNLEATESQFLALLDKAKTVEDILKVQRELSNVRGNIEQVKGRIQYLDRTTDMSFIEVMLQEEKTVGKDGWNILETLKSAVNGLIGFSKVIANIVIWLIIFIPLWAIVWAIVFFIRRWRKKAKRRASV
ncbi:DUF4349 domain-containing protein [Chloroflexota bacterium]